MNAYIKLSTKEYPRYIGDIEIDPAGMSDYAVINIPARPEFDVDAYVGEFGPAEEIDGAWYATWIVKQIQYEYCSNFMRQKRNKLLAGSDWTQLADAPVDKTVWATYRQALRDVPAQAGFPWDIQWPVEP